MRLVLVHADRAGFEATRAADREAETPGTESADLDGGVAALAAVEAGDAADPPSVGRAAAGAVREAADRLRVERVVVVPCGHLVDDPAPVAVVADVLDALTAAPPVADLGIARAPVGWDLALDLRARGHPNAVTTRRIAPEDGDGGDRSADREWFLLASDGDRRPVPPPDGKGIHDGRGPPDPALRAVLGRVRDGRSPRDDPVGRLLARTGVAEADPLSAAGERRLLPRGTVVRDAIGELVADRSADWPAPPVHTATTVDLDREWVRASLTAAPRRVAGGATALRPSAHLGHLSLLRDRSLAAADLPVAVSEVGTAFPADGPGGLVVPRITVACARGDRGSARSTFERAVELSRGAVAALGVDPVAVCRLSREPIPDRDGWIDAATAPLDRRALLAVADDPRPAVRLDLFGVADGRATPLSTVEVDPAAGRLAGVDGGAAVVGCAPVGALGRAVSAAVAAGARRERPRLPLWLSPTQVRLVPVGADHDDRCDRLAATLEAEGVRADVDDRPRTVGERIDRADREWVPFVAVVGDCDGTGALSVEDRRTGRERVLSLPELVERVRTAVDGRPSPGLPLARRLSDRGPIGTANVE